jgi:ribosomal 30S subunit maturation factor RimM
MNHRTICDEGRSRVGRVSYVASLSSQDAVVMILALDRKAAVPFVSEAMEFSTIVPTARLLTEIAA